jgi:hypothetical protein
VPMCIGVESGVDEDDSTPDCNGSAHMGCRGCGTESGELTVATLTRELGDEDDGVVDSVQEGDSRREFERLFRPPSLWCCATRSDDAIHHREEED